MSSEWPLIKLSELIKIKHGFAFKGEFFSDEPTELQLTTPGNFSIGGGFQAGKGKYYSGPYEEEYVLQHGDLIVTMTDLSKAADTLGFGAIIPNIPNIVWLHNQRVGLVQIKPKAPIVLEFLHYLLRSSEYRHWVVSTATGSTVKHTSPGRICDFEFRLPPKCVQVEIGRILTSLDDRITLLRETNATLEAIAQALFKSWFVDFDPVHANAGTQAPSQPAEIQALFPSRLVESTQGLIPEGWEICSVEDIAERVGMGPFGSNIKVSTFVETGIPVISGQHLKHYLVEDNTFNFITEDHALKLSKSCVYAGDVIFTHAGSIGQVSLLHRDSRYQKYVLSQRQFFLRCQQDKMAPEWMTQYFKSLGGQHQLLANTSQVGVPSIARPVSYLRSIKFVKPPIELVNKFAETADVLNSKSMALRQQISNLTQIRDTLLPRLISGQLLLPEAEAALEEVI